MKDNSPRVSVVVFAHFGSRRIRCFVPDYLLKDVCVMKSLGRWSFWSPEQAWSLYQWRPGLPKFRVPLVRKQNKANKKPYLGLVTPGLFSSVGIGGQGASGRKTITPWVLLWLWVALSNIFVSDPPVSCHSASMKLWMIG